MYVSVHGRGRSFKKGGMKVWNENLDPANPTAELSKFELVMLRKGYAVAKTYRSSDTLGGEVQVTLDDGTTYAEKNLNDNARVILDWVLLSENVLKNRLGRAPDAHVFLRTVRRRPHRPVDQLRAGAERRARTERPSSTASFRTTRPPGCGCPS